MHIWIYLYAKQSCIHVFQYIYFRERVRKIQLGLI